MLTRNDVLHIAKLAKITLQEDEVKTFQSDLSGIVHFIDQLNEVDTTGIEPTSQVTGLMNQMRSDEIQHCQYTDRLLDCSPHSVEQHQIKIPKIM